MKGRTAIAGLGMTDMGKVYGRTVTDFAAEALALALDDAGLVKADVDGLLMNANHSPEMAPMLQMSLGLEDLTLVNAMSAYGSSAGTMLQYTAHAITAGQATVGDFDGDGRSDPTVFRPSTGIWYQMRSTQGFMAQQFGISSDVPTPNAFVP